MKFAEFVNEEHENLSVDFQKHLVQETLDIGGKILREIRWANRCGHDLSTLPLIESEGVDRYIHRDFTAIDYNPDQLIPAALEGSSSPSSLERTILRDAVSISLLGADGAFAYGQTQLRVSLPDIMAAIYNGISLKQSRIVGNNNWHSVMKSIKKDPLDYLGERELYRAAETEFHSKKGDYRLIVFTSNYYPSNVVTVIKSHDGSLKTPLVRVHSKCFTGDTLFSDHCDCQGQLIDALEKIEDKEGFVIYHPEEGRGIGIVAKMRAYSLQRPYNEALDTYEANTTLGFLPDPRDYMVCSDIIKSLQEEYGFGNIRLITRNPEKQAALERFGIEVTGLEDTPVNESPHSHRYHVAQKEKGNHTFNKS